MKEKFPGIVSASPVGGTASGSAHKETRQGNDDALAALASLPALFGFGVSSLIQLSANRG